MKKALISLTVFSFILIISLTLNASSVNDDITLTSISDRQVEPDKTFLTGVNFTTEASKNYNEVTDKNEINNFLDTYMNGNKLDCEKSSIPTEYKTVTYDKNGLPILVYDVVLANGDIGQYYLPGTQIGKARAEKQENYYMYEVCLQDDGTVHYFDDSAQGDAFDDSHLPTLSASQIESNKLTKNLFLAQYY